MENKFTFKELKEMGMVRSVCNVGILPEQILEIKKLMKDGKYKSINKFVQEAVQTKITVLTGKDSRGEK